MSIAIYSLDFDAIFPDWMTSMCHHWVSTVKPCNQSKFLIPLLPHGTSLNLWFHFQTSPNQLTVVNQSESVVLLPNLWSHSCENPSDQSKSLVPFIDCYKQTTVKLFYAVILWQAQIVETETIMYTKVITMLVHTLIVSAFYLQNRSALAVNCWVINRWLEVSCKLDYITIHHTVNILG